MKIKNYPLKIENWGIDDYVVGSKGHHNKDAFMQEVEREGFVWPLGVPIQSYMKAVPDNTGSNVCNYIPSSKDTRGAFPVTYAVEAYGENQYKRS